MAISLAQLVAGTTSYIQTHNSNNATIEVAINNLEEAFQGSTGGAAAGGIQEIYDQNGLIGVGSYIVTPQGPPDKTVDVSAGAFFEVSSLGFYKKTTATLGLDFQLLSNNTYFIDIGLDGTPAIGGTSSTNTSIYSVVWDGVSIDVADITRTAPILFDGTDYTAVLAGGPLGGPYTSLDARLDDIENNLGGAADGTASISFKLRKGFAGTPASGEHGIFQLERGTESDVAIRYNETTNVWEFTNDGTTYDPIPTAGVSNLGTNEVTWTLDKDNVGAAVETKVVFEGGSGDDVQIRATAARELQFSLDDGATWHDFAGADGFNVGGGLTGRSYFKATETQVVNVTSQSDSVSWTSVDLTADLTEKGVGETAIAAILRVHYSDNAPANLTRVRFRKGGEASAPDDQHAVYAANSAGAADPGTVIVPLDSADTFEWFIEASGAGTATLKVYLQGYVVEKTGAGTTKVDTTFGSMVVAASSNVEFDQTGWIDRGLIWLLETSNTGMTAGTYDVEIYAKDTFLAADLLYKATGISFSGMFADSLPFFYEDADATEELHVKIINNGTGTGTYSVRLKTERFA